MTETMTTTPIAAGPNDVTVRPAAWMHDQPDRFDVIHAEAKALWLKAWPKQVEHYTIPLYRHQERQPLSTDDACALLRNVLGIDPVLDGNMLKMLRMVEQAHGILPPNDEAHRKDATVEDLQVKESHNEQ